MAASATFALKAGVWFRRGRLFIVSPDSLGTACPLSGRNSTYRPVQILEAGSGCGNGVMVEPLRHRQTKEAATDMFGLKPPRHTSTLPKAAVPGARQLVPQLIQ